MTWSYVLGMKRYTGSIGPPPNGKPPASGAARGWAAKVVWWFCIIPWTSILQCVMFVPYSCCTCDHFRSMSTVAWQAHEPFDGHCRNICLLSLPTVQRACPGKGAPTGRHCSDSPLCGLQTSVNLTQLLVLVSLSRWQKNNASNIYDVVSVVPPKVNTITYTARKLISQEIKIL